MTILVTGATGNIGRKVVDQLLARGATEVRALTTNPAKAALPPEVEVANGYVRDLESMPAALDGVSKMYLTSAPETVVEVVTMAREAGVRHIVDLSGEPETWWGSITTAVEASGVAWTHLWPGDFMENTLVLAEQIRRTGEVREPYPEGSSVPIAMDDIAAVAAAALLDDGDRHLGAAHLLTGPENLTRAQLVSHLGAALGRDIPVVPVTLAEAVEAFEPAMGENAEWYVHTILGSLDDDSFPPSPLVEELTGRPATRFTDWAHAHATDFR